MKNPFRAGINWLDTVFEEQKHTQKNTIAVLDGVRGLAIFFVISFHITSSMTQGKLLDWRSNPLAMSILTAGGTGVTLFFVLSGFLLFMPYARALLFASRWPLARTFYLRRVMRIWPGYYISLLILILFMQRDLFLPQNWASLGLFLSFFMDSSRLTFRQLNGPYWTLAVEWQFYMFLPLLMLGILLLVRRVPRAARLRAVTICLLGVIVLGLLVRFCGLYLRDHSTATFLVPRPVLDVIFFFIFGITGKYLEDFAVGMLVSLCYIYVQNMPPDHRFARLLSRLSLWLWSLGLLILLFSAMWHFQSDPHTPAWPFLTPIMPYYDWLSEMLLAWGFGMCIMAILFGPRQLQTPFAWKPLRWVGLISYGLYIWHLPFLELARTGMSYFPGLPYYASYALYWLWTLLITTPFCLLVYLVIEKPCMAWGDRWRKAIDARQRARSQSVSTSAAEQPVSAEPVRVK
jgi:peptidoglycan/LPS O-acetylase OafA/YrhL